MESAYCQSVTVESGTGKNSIRSCLYGVALTLKHVVIVHKK